MSAIDDMFGILESYEHLGKKVLSNGTKLIGHVPHVAPEAWFHLIFAPLSECDVSRVQEELEAVAIPKQYLNLLQRCNGLSVFSDHMNIFGLRYNYARTGDDVWQPYSIRTPNIDERPSWARQSLFIIGGYSSDGARVYLETSKGRVYKCKRTSSKPLQEWASIEEMLLQEAKRLSLLFDSEGRKR